jgi:hypothetical protein
VVVTRAEFDALLAEAVRRISASVTPDPADPASLAEQRDAIQEAQLLDAEAREFADAVDRSGKGIGYGAAVFIEGANGTVVITAREFEATPGYWRTVAGRPDREVRGPELLRVLHEAGRATAAGAH